MSSEDPFRTPSSSACVELRCPACERNLYIAPPDASVSLTTCPHLNCQHVALVCTGEALGRDRLGWEIGDGSVAVTLEQFIQERTRVSLVNTLEAAFAFAPVFILFVVSPLTMLAYAWREALDLLFLVAMLTSPATLLGLGMIVVIIVCGLDDRRDRRLLAAVRRQAFARARWQLAKTQPSQPSLNSTKTPTATP